MFLKTPWTHIDIHWAQIIGFWTWNNNVGLTLKVSLHLNVYQFNFGKLFTKSIPK